MKEVIEKRYMNKKVTITFIYDESGENLKDILEKCYRNEINKKRILCFQ